MKSNASYGLSVAAQSMACGALGNQAEGSWFLRSNEVGVAESNSCCKLALRASRSMIWKPGSIAIRCTYAHTAGSNTFFCSRDIPVHFFSSSVS